MPTFKWRIKSRIETFLSHNSVFDNLIPSFLSGLQDEGLFFVVIGANDGIDHDHIFPVLSQKNGPVFM